MNKERASHQNRALNRSQLKSVKNLRLRLKYAKLKVINGWHNRTLNEIESNFYYLKLPKQEKQEKQHNDQPINNPPGQKEASLDYSSSPSTSTTISDSSYSFRNGAIPPQAIQFNHLTTRSISPFKIPNIPASNIPKVLQNSPFHSHYQPPLNQDNDQQQHMIQSSFISNSTHTTTLTLPFKYLTPFGKIIKADGSASGQLMTNESNIFWPTGPLSSPSSTRSPSSSSKTKGSYNKKLGKTPERLFFKVGSGGTVEKINNNHQPRNLTESEDLFRDPVEDYKELYKQSSPASFLFNNHYHRPLLGSSSKPTPTRTFFNHPLDLLNSISPVRIRSHLHSDPHRPAPPAFVRLAASSLVSPSPIRTQSHLSKVFGAAPADRPGHGLTLDDDADDNDDDYDGNEENGDDEHPDNRAEEEDKENLVDRSMTNASSADPPSRSSPIRFSLKPCPSRPSSHRPIVSAPPPLDHEVEPPSGVDHIGLDELDQMNWE
ncbi:uncharacterized protein VP01_302g7 [Puccinia sorghi]|uniref:Uncharacterized protein n=1 Tax=Puccinia sorghi TaxID=27349 RepID=A0A0L6V066_9BASI|nr:uncharacterized protein VP01_302g7 [Puccinia sorghi]